MSFSLKVNLYRKILSINPSFNSVKNIILLLFTISNCFAQSVLLTPTTQSINTTKKGNNELAVNSVRNIDNNFLINNPGNSKLILSGDFFADNYEGLSSSSTQSIEFNNLNTNRWTIRDYKFNNSIEPEYNIDAFQILNKVTNFPTTVFHIEKSNSFIGINTNKPLSRLHIFNGYSGITATPTDELIIENNGNNFIQMMNPQASEAGITFGLPTSIVSGGIVYNSGGSGALQFRNNANQNRMTIISNGNVGIGTTAPTTKLDVNGNVKIGINGTAINEIIKVTVNKDIPSVAADGQQTVTFTVANAALNSSVYISPASALPAGLIIAHARVSVAGTVEVVFYNVKTTAIDPAAMNFFITVIN